MRDLGAELVGFTPVQPTVAHAVVDRLLEERAAQMLRVSLADRLGRRHHRDAVEAALI